MAKVIEGKQDATGKRFGIVVSRFNDLVTTKLLDGALETLQSQGVTEDEITLVWVPGSFEIPFAAKKLATSKQVDAVICLGALIQGETTHFDYIAQATSYGILEAGLESGVPVIFGVLTTDNVEQALERAGGKMGHKGVDVALAAIEMANVNEQLK